MHGEPLFLWLYERALRLFPGHFRRTFADEMSDVARQASNAASYQGWPAWLAFWLREWVTLPACLAREHWMAFTQPEANMSVTPAFQGADGSTLTTGSSPAPVSRRDLFLVALPHVLVGLLITVMESGVLENLIPNGSLYEGLVIILLLVFLVGGLLAGFILAWRAGWPGWSGAWFTYFGLAVFAALSYLINTLSVDDWLNKYNLFYLVIATLVAFALYYLTRANAMHGLLAGLTVVTITGISTLEFVPTPLRGLVTGWGWLILAITSVLALRAGSLRRALPLALLGSLLILIPFSWVGIYHGGMLNFDAPGPSWVQVTRALLPYYSLATCLLLAPQLARLLRLLDLELIHMGRPLQGQPQRKRYAWRHRLALLGELVMLAGVVILSWGFTSDRWGPYTYPIAILVAGFVLYNLGAGFLFSDPLLANRKWAFGLYLALLTLPWPLAASLPGPLQYIAYAEHSLPLGLPNFPEFGMYLSALLWAVLGLWVVLVGERLRLTPNRASALSS